MILTVSQGAWLHIRWSATCDIDDTYATGAITDGSNVMAGLTHCILIDSAAVWCSYSRNSSVPGLAPAQNEVLKTINGVKALQQRRFIRVQRSLSQSVGRD